MSLTAFVARKPVKEAMQRAFVKPRLGVRCELLAPPLTRHYSLVGGAFDYLLRFAAERLNPGAIAGRWIAEHVLPFVPADAYPDFVRAAEAAVVRARDQQTAYLRTGRASRALLESTLKLAKLDTIYRTGVVDLVASTFDVIDPADVDDLAALLRLVDPADFRAEAVCVCNPTFGRASALVGGADGDLALDDLLIDVKTTSKCALPQETFHQLIGYYALACLGGIAGLPPEHHITRLGLYFARHGVLHVIPVDEIVDPETWPGFLAWFEQQAAAVYGPPPAT